MSSDENGSGDRDAAARGRPDHITTQLTEYGWDSHWAELFERFAPAGTEPARVAMQHRGSYALFGSGGEARAEVLGRMRYGAAGAEDLPAVGDWVAFRGTTGGPGIIHAVLPRKSSFARKTAGLETTEQVLASNIDVVFVIAALDVGINLRRTERYLTMAWGSGAAPVVVLTKTDRCGDVAGNIAALEPATPGTPIHAVSAVTGDGIEELRSYIRDNRTATLLGPSGAGKSTLVNALCGVEVLKTAPIRYDGKGRHTTTYRQLVVIPGGGLIIDTPGMRELQLWDPGTGLDDAFEDIRSLALQCRFDDCSHDHEPGCAVIEAVENGGLSAERLASYKKLQRELRHLERRQDVRARAEERKKWKSINKAMRANTKIRESPRRVKGGKGG